MAVAGGGEALVKGRGGVGAEAGLLANGSRAVGLASINAVYHFVPVRRRVRLSPFVLAGGGGLEGADGWAAAVTVGGGVDFWPRDHVGVRLEFRDYITPDRGTVRYTMFRVGLVFR